MKNYFRALKHRNYRLFFAGQAVSVVGAWLQMTALPWLVYRLTGSALLLGVVGFSSQIFILLLAPFAGVFADYYEKRRILIITQILLMLQAFILAFLTLSGNIRIRDIIALAVLMSMVNAFDMPARQSFVIEMVGKDDLLNAIALNSFMFNSSRLIGPAIAGILIAAFGEGLCFLINGVSFVAVIISLSLIKTVPLNSSGGREKIPVLKNFVSGFRYVSGLLQVRSLLLIIGAVGISVAFLQVLIPMFVKDVYRLDSVGFGSFLSAMGLGAIAATLILAGKKSTRGFETIILSSAAAFGLCLVLFALSGNLYTAVPLLALSGFFMMAAAASTNTFIQHAVSDEMRGRVMGFFTVSFIGVAPIGSLTAGFIAHRLSAPAAVAMAGVFCIVMTLLLRAKVISNQLPAYQLPVISEPEKD